MEEPVHEHIVDHPLVGDLVGDLVAKLPVDPRTHEHIEEAYAEAVLPVDARTHEHIEEEHDESHPIIEKGEHHEQHEHPHEVAEYGVYPEEFNDNYHFDDEAGFDEMDHVIPEKREHFNYNEAMKMAVEENELEEGEYEDASHIIPTKGEHVDDVHYQPKNKWTPEFHGHGDFDEEETEEKDSLHRSEPSDGVNEYLEDAPKKLTPKTPAKDDPRLQIPKGKSEAIHDHMIVPKDAVPSPEHRPRYGEAYEHERKGALHGTGESAGLAAKIPTGERVM